TSLLFFFRHRSLSKNRMHHVVLLHAPMISGVEPNFIVFKSRPNFATSRSAAAHCAGRLFKPGPARLALVVRLISLIGGTALRIRGGRAPPPPARGNTSATAPRPALTVDI